MDIIRLSSADAKNQLMNDLFAIYTEALPPSEQKPRVDLEDMLVNTNYYFYVLQKDNIVIGFAIVYAPDNSDYYLLEYMAIEHNLRSEGYGGKLFDSMSQIFINKNMIIEIESPYQESEDHVIRQKRKVFYERHGSKTLQGLNYILPLETDHTPPDMLILINSDIYKNSVPKEKIKYWLTDIYVSVYGCKAEDKRINFMLENIPADVALV